jgi:CHRD domain
MLLSRRWNIRSATSVRSAIVGLVALAALAAGSPQATAATIFTAVLTNGQEVATPPVNPTTDAGAPRSSFGEAILVLNDSQTALSYQIAVFGIDLTLSQTPDLNDDLRAAHIHAPGAPGFNAGVVFGFLGTPFNEIAPNDLVVTPFTTGVGGIISGTWNLTEGNNTTLALQLPNLFAGLAYLNFHTVQYPGGEIRGQIIQAAEPALCALIALGGVALLKRRRRWSR